MCGHYSASGECSLSPSLPPGWNIHYSRCAELPSAARVFALSPAHLSLLDPTLQPEPPQSLTQIPTPCQNISCIKNETFFFFFKLCQGKFVCFQCNVFYFFSEITVSLFFPLSVMTLIVTFPWKFTWY